MKKSFLNFVAIVGLSVVLTSCFSQTYTVGNGAKTGVTVKEKNHFLVLGLIPIDTASPTEMAGESKDYTVNNQQSFVDGFLGLLTFGIYTPSSTSVTK
tara:strand:+ start:35173 stop:35466 length:294 start_codon:yes stop_codon:yes gene_type:complete